MLNPAIFQLRKALHQYPELSGVESATAQRIHNFINKYYPTEVITNIGGHGLLAIYEFAEPGKTIAIRCELDALPIQENNSFEHKSTITGVSHKCGHDGHMAIVAGLIFWLKEQQFKKGKIILLFQPAEETGMGAKQVVNDDKFKQLKIDYIFALHNIPKEVAHSIIIMQQGFSAEVISFSLELKGKKSHAAEPENGINPALGISEIISKFKDLNIDNPRSEEFSILTPIHLSMGQKSYGVSPAKGEVHYTIRTWSTNTMNALKANIEKTTKRIAQRHSLQYTFNWFEHFPASSNQETCNNYIRQAAIANDLQIIERPYPFKFGEDFGWYSKEYPTAMFGLGAGINTPALHNDDYDFPEEIIKTGINIFQTIIENILKE